MKALIATVDENFAEIDRLLGELRKRIGRAAEAVHVAAEAAKRRASKSRKRPNGQRRNVRRPAKETARLHSYQTSCTSIWRPPSSRFSWRATA